MDSYTLRTRDWLNKYYQHMHENGVYNPHQPIYGFRAIPGPDTQVNRYVITWQLMKTLSGLEMESLLDVGCGEGYKTAMARDWFDVPVRGADLSAAACARAGEIYGVAADVVDIVNLPYRDESVDVVVCSEVLEHVPDFKQGLSELLRVSRRAVVITVPLDSPRKAKRNLERGVPHAHIHAFDRKGRDFQGFPNVETRSRAFYHTAVQRVNRLADGIRRSGDGMKLRHHLYNVLIPFVRWIIGKRCVRWLMRLDDFLANHGPGARGLTVVLVKDESVIMDSVRIIPPADIINFVVPPHRLSR